MRRHLSPWTVSLPSFRTWSCRPVFPSHSRRILLPQPYATFRTCRREAVMHEPSSSTKEPKSLPHNSQHVHIEDAPSNPVTNAGALPETCANIHAKVQAFLSAKPRDDRMAAVQKQTQISLDVIAEALQRYSLDELSFSYNGGKDCLVLLILYLSALHTAAHRPLNPITLPPTLRTIYIVPPNPFPSVTAFVLQSSAEYRLALSQSRLPMRDAFAAYLVAHPHVRAIFVGTRRTDPHGAALTHFDPTDGGWPAFVRVHPVIDWHYADIWAFIRALDVRYCELYDQGYTSLGGTTDTLPNPALKLRKDGGEEAGFRPAYELLDDEEERLGRDR